MVVFFFLTRDGIYQVEEMLPKYKELNDAYEQLSTTKAYILLMFFSVFHR